MAFASGLEMLYGYERSILRRRSIGSVRAISGWRTGVRYHGCMWTIIVFCLCVAIMRMKNLHFILCRCVVLINSPESTRSSGSEDLSPTTPSRGVLAKLSIYENIRLIFRKHCTLCILNFSSRQLL